MNGNSAPSSTLLRASRYMLAGTMLFLLPGASYAADEVTYLIGPVSSNNFQGDPSDAWSIAYRSNWAPHFSSTISYLNDGHFPGHHRDGVTIEAWPQFITAGGHLTFAVGVGPFYYYDTTLASNGAGYADSHGLAWLYSAAIILNTGDIGPVFEIRYDHTAPTKSIETDSLFVGFGYRMTSDFAGGILAQQAAEIPKNEVTGFYGHTQVNSFAHQEAVAWSAEYRRQIWGAFRVSGGFLNEGNAQLIRRDGFTYEGWLEPSFFDDAFSVGVGFGGYSAIDRYRLGPGRVVSGIVSLTLSYRLVQHVDARFDWHRIVTDYNRDTDIVLFGLGVRF